MRVSSNTSESENNFTSEDVHHTNSKATIHDLPNECLIRILANVELCHFSDDKGRISYLGNVTKCLYCFSENKKCFHLHEREVFARKLLKLVCVLWRDIIDLYFQFESGARIIIPFSLR